MIHLRTGAPRAIIGTSSLNFDGLAPEQQLRAVQAFRDLLHAQSGPFQLYLRIRRVPVGEAKEPDAGAFPDRQAYLAAMTRSFISAHLQDAPVYQREIYLVVAPLQTGRQMLRSWLFRFDRSRDDPSFVASDLGTPLANRARSLLEPLRRIGSGYTRGIGAILLDPEAEYAGMIRELGGTYLHFAAGSGHAINVLDPLLFAADPEEPGDQLTDVLDLIGLMCGRLDEVERAQVEAAIRSVVGHSDATPVLGDIWRELERTQPGSRVSTILRRWVTGDLGRMFSAPTNVDLGAAVVGFNVRDLSEELIPPAFLILANWLWAALRAERRARHLLIDEVGLLRED